MQRFSLTDTAMILIDHQVGTNTWAATTPLELLRRNVIILAKFAIGTGMPLVLTSSQETNTNVQGPLMPELADIAPEAFAARVKRTGVVNAWDDEAFAAACRNTGGDHGRLHGPLCQRNVRQSLLDISVPMGGGWTFEDAEAARYSPS